MAFNPSNISSLTQISGQAVTFTLTVTNSSPINGFAVFVRYNQFVLQVQTIDYGGTVLGNGAQVSGECVDKVPIVGIICEPLDNPGVFSLILSLSGNVTTAPKLSGTLFRINFKVIGQGFSPLHIIEATLTTGNATSPVVPTTKSDAYFNNINCGNALCTPPKASITYSPIPSLLNRPVTLNATGSKATNAGPPTANVTDYIWDFGDFSPTQESTIGANGLPIPSIQHVYRGTCNCTATVEVVDSYGIVAFATVVVDVIAIYIDLYPGDINPIPQFRVVPGTIVNIGVVVINNSTFPESGTLTVDVEGQAIGAGQAFQLGAFRQRTTLMFSWNTSGYSPRVYRIDAVIPPIANENNTRNNNRVDYVELISQAPTGLASLSLLQVGGLGILVLAGAGFGISKFIRRSSGVEEELEETK